MGVGLLQRWIKKWEVIYLSLCKHFNVCTDSPETLCDVIPHNQLLFATSLFSILCIVPLYGIYKQFPLSWKVFKLVFHYLHFSVPVHASVESATVREAGHSCHLDLWYLWVTPLSSHTSVKLLTGRRVQLSPNRITAFGSPAPTSEQLYQIGVDSGWSMRLLSFRLALSHNGSLPLTGDRLFSVWLSHRLQPTTGPHGGRLQSQRHSIDFSSGWWTWLAGNMLCCIWDMQRQCPWD